MAEAEPQGETFDVGVFAVPHGHLVELTVGTSKGVPFVGGWTPEQARSLGRALLGAADVAEGQFDTDAAKEFFERGSMPEGNPTA